MFLNMKMVYEALGTPSASPALNQLSRWAEWSVPVLQSNKHAHAAWVTYRNDKPVVFVNLRAMEELMSDAFRLQFILKTTVDDFLPAVPVIDTWMIPIINKERDTVGPAFLVTYMHALIALIQKNYPETKKIVLSNPWNATLDLLEKWINDSDKTHNLQNLGAALPMLYEKLREWFLIDQFKPDSANYSFKKGWQGIKAYCEGDDLKLADVLWTNKLTEAPANIRGYGVNLRSIYRFTPLTLSVNSVMQTASGRKTGMLLIKYVILHELLHYTHAEKQFGQEKKWFEKLPNNWVTKGTSAKTISTAIHKIHNYLYDAYGNSILNLTKDKFAFKYPTGIYAYNIANVLVPYIGAPTVIAADVPPNVETSQIEYWSMPNIIPWLLLSMARAIGNTIPGEADSRVIKELVTMLEAMPDEMQRMGMSRAIGLINNPQNRDRFKEILQGTYATKDNAHIVAEILANTDICPGDRDSIKLILQKPLQLGQYNNAYEMFLWYTKTLAVGISWKNIPVRISDSNTGIGLMDTLALYNLIDSGYLTGWYPEYLQRAKDAKLLDINKFNNAENKFKHLSPQLSWDILEDPDNSHSTSNMPPDRYDIPPLEVPPKPKLQKTGTDEDEDDNEDNNKPQNGADNKQADNSEDTADGDATSNNEDDKKLKMKKSEKDPRGGSSGRLENEADDDSSDSGDQADSEKSPHVHDEDASLKERADAVANKERDKSPSSDGNHEEIHAKAKEGKLGEKMSKDVAKMEAELAKEVGDEAAAKEFAKEAEDTLKTAEQRTSKATVSSADEIKQRKAEGEKLLKDAGFKDENDLPPVPIFYPKIHQKVIDSHKVKSRIQRKSYARPNRRRHDPKFLIPGKFRVEAAKHKWILCYDVSSSVLPPAIQIYRSISKWLMLKSPDADNARWYAVLGTNVIEQAQEITSWKQLNGMLPYAGDGLTDIVSYIAPFVRDSRGYTGIVLFTDGDDSINRPTVWRDAAKHLLIEVIIVSREAEEGSSELLALDKIHRNIHPVEIVY